MAYRDWMLPEDDQELRKQAGIEASALSRIRPEDRPRFVRDVGTSRGTPRMPWTERINSRRWVHGRPQPPIERVVAPHPRLRREWDDFINTISEVYVKYGGEFP